MVIIHGLAFFMCCKLGRHERTLTRRQPLLYNLAHLELTRGSSLNIRCTNPPAPYTVMAPSKKEEKEAKLSPEQSSALILDYLRKQNRPYSATDISANLKNRVTKTAAAKILKDLHERKEIDGRAAGKQIVYHAVQVGLCGRKSCALNILLTRGTRFRRRRPLHATLTRSDHSPTKSARSATQSLP